MNKLHSSNLTLIVSPVVPGDDIGRPTGVGISKYRCNHHLKQAKSKVHIPDTRVLTEPLDLLGSSPPSIDLTGCLDRTQLVLVMDIHPQVLKLAILGLCHLLPTEEQRNSGKPTSTPRTLLPKHHILGLAHIDSEPKYLCNLLECMQ